MTDLRRTFYGVAIVVAVTLAAQAVGRARRESHAPRNAAQIARFTHIEGKVQLKRAGTLEWIQATLAVPLLDGDLVQSGDGAKATIQFPDGTYLSVRPNSLIAVSIPRLDAEGYRAPHPYPLPTDVALLVLRDLAPLALTLAVVGGLAFVVSRIAQKIPWGREFRRREVAAQRNGFAQKFPVAPTAPARLSMPNGGGRGTQALVEELLRGSQIRTVFHPIVDLCTRRVMGWEALSRGPSGTHLHEPLEMFAAANNLLFELDRHCFSTALSSARELPKDTKLFINVLPSLFFDPSCRGRPLVEMLERQGLAPERIVLEISERYSIENNAIFVEAKSYFTNLGFEVAVDNLGAGYSGLERMAHLQPHYLKLSRQLARDIDSSYIRREMTRALKNFADRIGSAIIATGIEREGELKVLQEMGVLYCQGWLLGLPLDSLVGEHTRG